MKRSGRLTHDSKKALERTVRIDPLYDSRRSLASVVPNGLSFHCFRRSKPARSGFHEARLIGIGKVMIAARAENRSF
jgi:hypothetical protein